jgi:hypothetical protein
MWVQFTGPHIHQFTALQNPLKKKIVGFEVFTAVAMHNAVFWVVAP